ncbi:MAG: sensor histidine kinase [Acidobacteriota bacterium]
MAVLTFCCGILGVVALRIEHVEDARTMDRILHELDDARQLRVRTQAVIASARGYLLTADDRYERAFVRQRDDVAATLAQMTSRGDTPPAQIEAIRRAMLDYLGAIMRDRAARPPPSAELATTFERDIEPHSQELLSAVETVDRELRARVQQEHRRAANKIGALSKLLLVGSGASFASCVLLAIMAARRLSRRFDDAESSKHEATRSAAARKAMLDVVSHDLRTPITSVLLAVEMLRMQHGETPQLGRLARVAHQMKRLVDDLLDASRAETTGLQLELHGCEVRDLLDGAAQQMQDHAAARGVRVEVCSDVTDVISVDRGRIIQIVANLTGNALRLARSGDVITLAARRREAVVRFSVADSGPGISPAELEHLFEPYRPGSGRSRSGSLGLGLFICRTLVEAHGGRLGVDSTIGKGSTFWFELPLQHRPDATLLAPIRLNLGS